MQIPVIKKLVENYSVDELEAAENCLMEELPLPMAVAGEDDGEVLTHLIAAVWIIEKMENDTILFSKSPTSLHQKR